jgi:protein-S-isoprenylcysteine O-methyltransferase Ste14
MSEAPGDRPGVVIFPPLLFAICVVCGVIAHVICPYRPVQLPWMARAGGAAALCALGLSLATWGKRTMEAAGTNVRPDRPALAIVEGGPFAFVRNPLYLSLIVLHLGIGVALASPAFLVFVVPLALVLHFGVVLREERYLESKFGDAYRRYKERVRRWL